MALEYTTVTYSDRGPWGDSSYPGNTNGWLIKDILESYRPRHVLDPMEGSGTTRFVCREMKLPFLGFDIKRGTDISSSINQKWIREQVIELTASDGIDFIWWDPPYYNMKKYAPELPGDISNCKTYPEFLNRMKELMRFLASLLSDDGIIALELADFRRPERTYFIADDTTTEEFMRYCKLRKEIRVIHAMNLIIKKPERFRQYLARVTKSDELPIELDHEYITILRNNFPGRMSMHTALTRVGMGLE